LMHSLGYERGSVAGRCYGYNKRILDELIQYTKESGLFQGEEIRHALADVAIEIETQRVLSYETIWKMSKGGSPVYEPSRDKVFNDHILERLATLGTEILGGYSQIDPLSRNCKWTRLNGYIEKLFWFFLGYAFAAGTDEVELNIVGQFGLKLPKSY
ncbi:MAG: acyl-CoA dehydrogenase family protein, partial [Pseudomonadota bacterium]